MITINRIHDNPIKLNINTMVGIDLDNSDFHRAILNGLDMRKASFYNCDFRSAEINNVLLDGAKLEKARLIMVESNMTSYQECRFNNALLLDSVFTNSNFSGANFTNAILRDSNFSNSNFRGAILLCDGIETCKLINVTYDLFTQWNQGFEPQKHGAILVGN